MEPLLIMIPGILGGLVLAFLSRTLQRGRSTRASADPFRLERLSTDTINMAHIRVAGVGGLGLVAMAVVVALSQPRIRQSLEIGLVLGAMLGAVLILYRRRRGPMPSSGQRPGANTVLSIDDPLSPAEDPDPESSKAHAQDLLTAPAISSRTA